MNSSTSLDRHKEITLLFLKHATLRAGNPGEAAARSLARDVEGLGLAFVRAAKSLSVRSDLIPTPFLDAFAALDETIIRENEEAEPFEVIEQVIEDELGKKIPRAFATFDSEPVGFSGSGQIHHAVLHDGRHVAVRVQRPSVRQRIVKDLDTMVEIAAFLDHPSGRGNNHRFSRHIDRHRLMLVRELDYRREETALIELHETAGAHSRLRVPVVVQEYCSPRILTTEVIDGKEIWEVPSSRESRSGRDLAEQFLTFHLDQVLVHGFVHPAPDLENILITDDGSLVMTEACGAIKIGPASRSLFNYLLTGICGADAVTTAEAALRIGHHSGDESKLDRAAFLSGIRDALQHAGIAARIHHVARAASSIGIPFHPDVCRLGDLFGKLPVITSALSPRFDTEKFVAEYLRVHVEESGKRTLRFPSPSAA